MPRDNEGEKYEWRLVRARSEQSQGEERKPRRPFAEKLINLPTLAPNG